MTGRVASDRGKPRPWKAGENCHFWKGGVSKVNRGERNNFQSSLEYRNFRREVLIRDNYACVLCGDHSYKGRGGHCYLHVDHIKPYSLYPELRLDLNNARTLCKDCHYKTDTYGAKVYRKNPSLLSLWKIWYQLKYKEKYQDFRGWFLSFGERKIWKTLIVLLRKIKTPWDTSHQAVLETP